MTRPVLPPNRCTKTADRDGNPCIRAAGHRGICHPFPTRSDAGTVRIPAQRVSA